VLACPVRSLRGPGVTRNISRSGLLLETGVPAWQPVPEIGEHLELLLQLSADPSGGGRPVELLVQSRIARVEYLPGPVWLVGAAFQALVFQPAPQSNPFSSA
jgi:hypothetical protein